MGGRGDDLADKACARHHRKAGNDPFVGAFIQRHDLVPRIRRPAHDARGDGRQVVLVPYVEQILKALGFLTVFFQLGDHAAQLLVLRAQA